MNWLDYLFIGILAFSTLIGLFRGLVRSVFSILAIIFGFAGAAALGPLAAPLLKSTIEQPAVRTVIAAICVFLAVWVVLRIVAWLITKALASLKLSWANRLGGGAFGILRGLAVCGLVLLALTYMLEPGSPTLKKSVLRPQMNKFVVAPMVELLPKDVDKELDKRREALGETLDDAGQVSKLGEKLKQELEKGAHGLNKTGKVLDDLVKKGKEAAGSLAK
ncbi:MAG: CvpA family protein [Deltaproteobacteria bacterium]|nr:CvpA family protein [Deltaproteobacteria bacterium]